MAIFGNWAAVALYASFFVSLIYSLALPRGLWRKYGTIYAAWIVAFYVEMFGFPFTLYLLVSLFGTDLLGLEDPRPLSLIVGSSTVQAISQSLALTGVLMVALGWTPIYYARGRLVSWGIYRVIKHPQYLGLMLIATGLLLNFPTIPTLLM